MQSSRATLAVANGSRIHLESFTARRSVQALSLTVVFAAGLTASLASVSPEPRTSLVEFLNAVMLALAMFPAVHWFLGSRRAVPAFEAICLAHVAYFGVTGLLLPNQYTTHFTATGWLVPFSDDELASTLAAVIAGLLALELGFWAFFVSPLARKLPAVDVPLTESRLRMYLVAVVLGGLALNEARAIGVTPASDSPLGAVIGILGNQITVAAAILAYLVFGGMSRRRGYVILLVIASAGAALVGISSSLVENAFIIPFVIAIVAVQLRREVVLVLLVAMAASYLLFIQPVKLRYRTLVTDSDTSLTFVDRMLLWGEAATFFLDGNDANAAGTATQDSTNGTGLVETARTSVLRFDYVHQFALMRVYTPDLIPYYQGASYSYFLVGWVPRLVWPDKPSALEGNNRMVIDYGVLSERAQTVTTAGLGLIPEAYANFGDVGIIVIMAVQGAVLAAVTRAFTARASIAANAVLISILVFLVNGVGGITSVMYGGLLQNLAANALVIWLAAGRLNHIRDTLSRRLLVPARASSLSGRPPRAGPSAR